jgi:hypothetical protein
MPFGCPSCPAPLKHNWHWIICPTQQPWRDKQIRLLTRRLSSLQTDPSLKIMIVRALKSLLHNGTCDFSTDVLSEDEQVVINAQTSIGWPHFLCVRLATKWSTAQRRQVERENFDPSKFSGPTWTAKIIQHIWQALLAHWNVRNKALHGETFQEAD